MFTYRTYSSKEDHRWEPTTHKAITATPIKAFLSCPWHGLVANKKYEQQTKEPQRFLLRYCIAHLLLLKMPIPQEVLDALDKLEAADKGTYCRLY